MKHVVCRWMGWLALALPVWAAEPSSRALMNEGRAAFEQSAFTNAATFFSGAAERAPAEGLDPARAQYNEGQALARSGQWQAAAERYQDALKSPDLNLQADAFYNRGNVLTEAARAQAQQKDLKTAVQTAEQALTSYQSALALRPQDRDAKVNHELTAKDKAQWEEALAQQPPPPEQQQQDKQDQDQKEQPDQKQDSSNQDQDQSEQGEQPPPSPEDQQPSSSEASDADQEQKGDASPSEDQTMEQGGEPKESLEQMTEEEALRYLDALRDEEQAQRDQTRIRLGKPVPVDKDW